MVKKPDAWAWSSYRAHVGLEDAPVWLDTEGLHGHLLGRAPATAVDRRRAASRYARLVAAAHDVRLWDEALRQQIYLGDKSFVERMQKIAAPQRTAARDIPKAQRRTMHSLAQWLSNCASREEALYRAHAESGLTMSAIAKELGLSVSRVSRLIARVEEAKGKT